MHTFHFTIPGRKNQCQKQLQLQCQFLFSIVGFVRALRKICFNISFLQRSPYLSLELHKLQGIVGRTLLDTDAGKQDA